MDYVNNHAIRQRKDDFKDFTKDLRQRAWALPYQFRERQKEQEKQEVLRRRFATLKAEKAERVAQQLESSKIQQLESRRSSILPNSWQGANSQESKSDKEASIREDREMEEVEDELHRISARKDSLAKRSLKIHALKDNIDQVIYFNMKNLVDP